MKNSIIHFHIGRGGRSFNPGHWEFVGERKITETSNFLSEVFQDESGEYYVPGQEAWEVVINEDGSGEIHLDGTFTFDTDFCIKAEDIADHPSSAKMEAALERSAKKGDDLAAEILKEYF